MSGVYLYALLGANPATSPGVGVSDEPLRTVDLGGLFALVGDVPAALAPSPATLTAQDAVLRRLATGVDAILPARFGTLVADDATLVESLMARRTELTRALAQVSGCEQMTLRVWGEQAAPQADAGVTDAGPGARYLAARRRARDNRSTRSRLCTDWTPANAPGILLALLDWRGPIRCQRSGRSAVSARVPRASWTRFSPKSTWPAA